MERTSGAPAKRSVGDLDPDLVDACRTALKRLSRDHSRGTRERGADPLRTAVLCAELSDVFHALTTELVRDVRDEHGLSWATVGEAFGIRAATAHTRFADR